MGFGNPPGRTAELKRHHAERQRLLERARAAEARADTAEAETRRLTAVLNGITTMASRATHQPPPQGRCAWCYSPFVDCPWHRAATTAKETTP